jgi:hypothetical protein
MMNEFKQTWSEVADRLEALELKLKLHGEQTGGTELPEALNRLGHSLQETFEAAGNAFKDEAVREDVREIGRLVASAPDRAGSAAHATSDPAGSRHLRAVFHR